MLAGDDIPLGALVIGCCEAFDVACFGVYQAPRGKEGALAMVQDEAGTHFSPAVVTALVRACAVINPTV
jgi:response regulator RpfG family c-di-GMP phosphodiesterase